MRGSFVLFLVSASFRSVSLLAIFNTFLPSIASRKIVLSILCGRINEHEQMITHIERLVKFQKSKFARMWMRVSSLTEPR